ncbi:MAG: precorrin-6Y C5,15-methyltransferase (decarboxylating) subunit CbiT, partial [Lachnospiraceae bacterium]|nr:precorrin-6Y C5,15-methyltransferase (decarboxylating) subunit CbiT [Candidatus Equihabitans merdae]
IEALEKDGLYVLWIHHEGAREHMVTPGIPDEAFLRDKVPMTKEEIRMVSLCRMHLTSRSVVWDVGAGSGSVSIEAAAMCPEGEVYAVEMKETAIALLKANKAHFAADNMYIVEGAAPESLKDLPAPTHVFVGGSSGEMEAVLRLALEKNPEVRLVINAITVETIAEATRLLEELPFTGTEIIQMQVSHAEKLGRYHLMKALNPIYILSATGCGDEG